MKKDVTMKDVAEEADVSVSTVSRVINDIIDKDSELGVKVWTAVERLNYIPNAAARFMKGQNTGTIGLLLPDLSNPFFTSIAAGAITRAQQMNNNIIISSANGSLDQEKRSLQHLSKSVLDGLIYCPISRNEVFEEIEYFKNIPVVISYRRNVVADIPHVYVDNIKGGYIATKYMMRLNRRKICFIAGFWDIPDGIDDIKQLSNSKEAGFYTSLDRFKGYRKALKEEGIPYDEDLIFITNYDYNAGYNVAKDIISSGIDCDAILAPNDLVASGIIKFLSSQGISVPEDISVIGYDDGIIAPITNPALTSINQNSKIVGEKSVDLLLDILEGEDVNDYVVDVDLSIRKSTSFLKINIE